MPVWKLTATKVQLPFFLVIFHLAWNSVCCVFFCHLFIPKRFGHATDTLLGILLDQLGISSCRFNRTQRCVCLCIWKQLKACFLQCCIAQRVWLLHCYRNEWQIFRSSLDNWLVSYNWECQNDCSLPECFLEEVYRLNSSGEKDSLLGASCVCRSLPRVAFQN